MSDAGGTFIQRVIFEGDSAPLVEAIHQVSTATSQSIAQARAQVVSGELAPGDYSAQLKAAQAQLETIIAESRAAIREFGGIAAPQSLGAVSAAAQAGRRQQIATAGGPEGFASAPEAAGAATAAVGLTAANERMVVAANVQATAVEGAAAAEAAAAAVSREKLPLIQKTAAQLFREIEVRRELLGLEETALTEQSGLLALQTEYSFLGGQKAAKDLRDRRAGRAAGTVAPDQATLNAQAIEESELALMKAQAEATRENLALQTEEKLLRQKMLAELTVAVETQALQNMEIIYGRAYAERASQLSVAAKRELLPIVRSSADTEAIGSGQAAQKLSNTEEAAVRERILAEQQLYAESLAERNINAKRSAFAARDLATLETTQADVAGQALTISGEKLLAERQRIAIAEASLGREVADLSEITDITALRARRVVLEKALSTQMEAQLAEQAVGLGLPNPNPGGRGFLGGMLGAQGGGLARGLVGGVGAIAVFSGLRESVTYAVQLEKSLAAVQSRMEALGQGDQFQNLTNHILQMSRESGQSAVNVSAASVRMVAAFGNVSEGVQATESAIRLAVVAGSGLSETADQLIAIGKAYNLTGQQLTQTTDVIYATATKFGVTVAELTRGMATLAQSGQFGGYSQGELAALLGKVAQVSQTDANQAAERLTRILPLVDAKANQLLSLARQDQGLGAVLKPEDFAAADSASRVFKILGENFNNFTKETQSTLLSIVGSGRGAQSLLPIFTNFKEVMAASAETAQHAGGVNRAYQQQQETLALTVKRLREEFNQLTLAIMSSGVFDAFNSVLKVTETLVRWFNELNSVSQKIPGELAAIAIALKLIDFLMMKIAGEGLVGGIFSRAAFTAGGAGVVAGSGQAALPGLAAETAAGTGIAAFLGRFKLFNNPGTFAEGAPGVGPFPLALTAIAAMEANKGLNAVTAPDTKADDSLLKLEEDFKNTERNKRRAGNNPIQFATRRYAATVRREAELRKKIAASDPSIDFSDIDAAIKKQQELVQSNNTVGNQASADEAAARAAENAPISEQPIAAVKAAYDAGVVTTQVYLDRLAEERRITLELAKSGVQRNTNLTAAANITKEINTLVDKQALDADQLISSIESATGNPNAAANNISRLIARLSGPNQLLDPTDRQKVAGQIYDAERKQLDDMVGRARSAIEAQQVGAQGIRVPDSARAAVLVAQITASNPKFVQALTDAAGGDKALGQAILESYAARVVAGETQDQALRESVAEINAQRKAAYDTQSKLYNDTVAANRGLPSGERTPLPAFPTYTPITGVGETDATGAPGATAQETPDQKASREKAANTEKRQLATEKVNADAALAQARARGNAFVIAQAEVDKAKQEQLDAEQQLADAGSNAQLQAAAEIAKTKALADKVKADNQFQDANTDIIDAQLGLTEALATAAGDNVGAARKALERGQNKLNALIAIDQASKIDPSRDPAVLAQKGVVANLQKTALDTQRSTDEAREKFLLDTHQITVGAYIAFLQGELHSVGVSIADQQRLQLEIYNLQTQGSGPFNIPSSVKLPSLYEVRRIQSAETGHTGVDNRTINVNMYINNGMDEAAAKQFVSDFTQSAASVYGTVTRRYP